MQLGPGSSLIGCIAAAALVFVLWLLLAGEVAPPTIISGLAVAAAAAAWLRLVDA